jgi:hypothetical protein
MELVEQLVSQLGISSDQAEGGLGLIMKMAQEKLGAADFSQLGEIIPGADALIGKAPETGAGGGEAGGGLLGQVTSAVGGLLGGGDDGGGLGGLAGLAGGFSALGLDVSKIGDFVSMVLAFVKEKGGDQAKGLLEGLLK